MSESEIESLKNSILSLGRLVDDYKIKYQKLLEFVKELIIPLKDRDAYFEAWQADAENLLKKIGEI